MPADVVAGLRLLPTIAESTAAMAEVTKALPRIEREIKAVAKATQALPPLSQSMSDVAETTRVLPPMDDRMASIENAMPVLVEVQKSLARVPDTLERLDTGVTELSGLLDRLLHALDELGESVNALHAAVGPIGRIARRLPGRSRS
jgi:uncharacterized protein YoxC